MVLFDMVGDCDLAIPMEARSDPGLYGAFAAADGDVFSNRTFPVDDDHTPFLDRGIPAVDLIDFDYGPGPPPGGWWHTTDDTVDKVCPESLDAVGEAALKALPEIGAG
jgi:glutaminyl-peptide cyclotransferase